MRRARTGAARPGESARPPRYLLMTAAARLPQREAVDPHAAFERDCPACGRSVLFTQIDLPDGMEYLIEEHDCV